MPNLRFFSLNENNSDWATWNRSDYFYPEMIPEPDYSDSGDDVESEEEDGPYPRSAFERLRELTEVYVSNVDSKKTPLKPKKGDSKKAGPTSTADPKQTKGSPKDESKRPAKPTSKATQAKKSPPRSPKTPAKAGAKTSSEASKVPAKGSASSASGAEKSPKPAHKSPPKTKSPPPVSKSPKPTSAKKSPSATKKTTPAAPEAKAKVSPAASKTKPEAKPKSPPPPPPPAKSKTAKPAAKGKASPKAKAAGPSVSKMASPAGDATERSAKSPPSSPSDKKAQSPASSAASEEQSSEDEQLIKPRKPLNPYLESTERQKLHKELKFSQKYGKLGASSKTELQLALERYTENKMKRELNAEEKTSLEKILEFQAKKIEMQETMDKSPSWVDRLQKPPVPAADPQTDEFYRVHARVVSSNILTHCFLSDDDRSECSSSRRSDSGSDG